MNDRAGKYVTTPSIKSHDVEYTILSIDSTATILYSTPHFSGRIAYLPGVEHEISFAVVEALLLLFFKWFTDARRHSGLRNTCWHKMARTSVEEEEESTRSNRIPSEEN